MASYSTNEFKGGLKIMIDGDPCAIIENEFVKPGKGQAFNRVKIRNLKTGRVIERTFKSGESVESADVMDVELQYLYNDGEFWHFMDPQTYEQLAAGAAAVGDAAKWLKEQDICLVTLWNGTAAAGDAAEFCHADRDRDGPGCAWRHLRRRRQAGHPGNRCRCPRTPVYRYRRDTQDRHSHR